MKVFGECFFYEYYLSIFVTATNKQIYLPMPNSSACRGKKQCAQCPKAVDNAIIYASHLRGFHIRHGKYFVLGTNSLKDELTCMQLEESRRAWERMQELDF